VIADFVTRESDHAFPRFWCFHVAKYSLIN
jgi:hypothetical protein